MTSPGSVTPSPTTGPTPRAHRGWYRALRIAGYVVVGVELLYLVAANSFLNLKLLPLAFSNTNQIKASVASGWTLIPGRVHARHVRVTFQDYNLQFVIDVERAFLVIHLSELLHHTFHASHLRADGISFRMRHRVDPWSKHEPAVGAFPPIPEFTAPAVFEARAPEPPIRDSAYELWTIHLDDVDVGVKELWVQAFRYRGQGRARGQFQLEPARQLWVGPASLDLEPGLLSAGGYRVAPGLHGRIECVVHPFDVRVPDGMAVFRYISAHVRLDSPELDPQVYALLASPPAAQVSSTGGSLHLDLETRHGVFTQQSRLEVLQRGLQLRTPELELDAERVALQAGGEGVSAGEATLIIDRGTVKEPIALGYPPHIAHLSATVVSDHRDAARDFSFQEARLNEARLALGDSRWFNRWLKDKDFQLSGGGVSVLARGRYANSLIDADAVLETDGLGALLGSKHVRYAGGLLVRVMHVDPKELTGSLAADITGRSFRAELGDGQFALAGLRAHVFAKRDALGNALRGQAWLSALSSKSPELELNAPELSALVDSLQRPDGTQLTSFSVAIPKFMAEGRGARLTSAATARGTFAQSKNKPGKRLDFAATLLAPLARFGAEPTKTALTPRVEVHGALTSDAQGALSGRVSLLPAAWRVDAANMRFSGRSALAVDLDALDLEQHSGTVRAKLTSTGVTVGDTTQNANCAWSRIQVLDLDATAKLLARNTTSLSLHGELGQAELSWGDFTTRADIGIAARFEQGMIDSGGEAKLDLSFRHAAIQSGDGTKTGWSALARELDVTAELRRKDGKFTGTAQMSTQTAQGRIGMTRLSADVQAAFKVDSLDLALRTAHASGAVRLRNVALPNAPEPVSKWWADVQVDSLYGHAAQNLELGGTFRAQLRDATPGLAVLASEGSLPKWIPSAFPLRGLTVIGSMARRCRLTDIHLVELNGGPAVARGRLQSLPDGFHGALLLRLAGFQAISAGLDFDAEHSHVGLFNGDSWLADLNQKFDRKSDDAVKLVCPPDANQCTEDSAGGAEQASRSP